MNKPTIIPAEKYDISADSFSEAAIEVVKELQESGYEAYLVGGCVRDLLIGRTPKDFDVSTNASPEEVKKVFSNCRIIGRRFRICHVRINRELIEVSTFRANPHEKENADKNEHREGEEGQLIRDNVFGTCDEDAWRRDFSINALYYNPAENVIIDYMNSIDDIKNGILRSIGDMETRFTEDPVRMLRIIRFAAKFDFAIPAEAEALIHNQKNLISTVSAPRLFEEVLKLFHGGQAIKSFEMLRKFGLFKLMFPFTSEYLVDGEMGMAERALSNTDKRIEEGKGVIPAFLFSCLLWDPLREDAHNLLDQGKPASKAWRIAMTDALRDQSQFVSIPRRMADTVMEIWTLHFRLVSRKPKVVFQLMNHRRFRAAYDFMLLRTSLSEVDQELADWWTKIQEVDEEAQQQMVDDLIVAKQNDDDEPNFNSVEYISKTGHDRNGFNKGNKQGYHSGNKGNQNGRRKNSKFSKKGRRNSNQNNNNRSNSNGNNNQQSRNEQNGHQDQNSVHVKSNSKNSRSNFYRNRRKKMLKTKKEESYF